MIVHVCSSMHSRATHVPNITVVQLVMQCTVQIAMAIGGPGDQAYIGQSS
jgi:hypothetical protein